MSKTAFDMSTQRIEVVRLHHVAGLNPQQSLSHMEYDFKMEDKGILFQHRGSGKLILAPWGAIAEVRFGDKEKPKL